MMSVYTMPASGGAEEGGRYRQALLDLLGDQDSWGILRTTPMWCANIIETTPPEHVLMPEAPGKWSISSVIHHYADSELVLSCRLRKVLAEDQPQIIGYDQDLWANQLHYADRAPLISLALFQATRTANLDLLDRTAAHDLARFGLHNERGRESVSDMIQLYAAHDLVHRRQIERVRTTVAKKL